tara:strand:+ start:338 stop:577 length:240 start_codon:yes stop_codon:yes gene_type:complete
MVKNLCPILYGKPLTEEELKFEEAMTFGLMNVLEARVIKNSTDMKNCANKGSGGMKCAFFMCCYFACCNKGINKKFLKR